MIDETQTPKPGLMSRWIANRTGRFVTMAALILLMLIPLSMVSSIVTERHGAYNMVLADISSLWGNEQVLTGPLLIVPYTETRQVVETRLDQAGLEHSVTRTVSGARRAVILPDTLRVKGTIDPEYRFRGIYKSLVYSDDMEIDGAFSGVESKVERLFEAGTQNFVHWDRAFLVVGLSDPKGIASVEPVSIGGRQIRLAPGTQVPDLLAAGFHALLNAEPSDNFDFATKMRIKGSGGFRLSPLGELSTMHLESDWAHPSFFGDLLPASHKIDAKGFVADWSIPHLVRSYPQSWTMETSSYAIAGFSAGVRLFEPVTIYTESTRAVKYGFLFIALTFLTLALMELVTKARPSMVQYVMIGIALSLFYLLLIALSEHIGFNLAYAVAAAAVIGLTSAYCLAVLAKKRHALVVMGVLAALYGVLFMILRAEDWALLTGSILLLLAVAVTMYFTRALHKRQ